MKLPARTLMGRIVFASPPDHRDQLRRMRIRLEKASIDPELRSDIDNTLRRLMDSPKAIAAMWPAPVGRKPDETHEDIGLHYLVLKEFLGRGKSIRARQRVAKIWDVQVGTVAEIFSKQQHNAKYWLNYWIESAERENQLIEKSGITIAGKFHPYADWTRPTILEALDRDLTAKAKKNSGK
jgi:hypothetical protein